MKILCLSDTHLENREALPAAVLEAARTADLILHAGDQVHNSVVEELRRYAPVEAVAGNMDPPQLQSLYSKKKLLSLDRFRVGLIHGQGAPRGMVERVTRELPQADVIVFGRP